MGNADPPLLVPEPEPVRRARGPRVRLAVRAGIAALAGAAAILAATRIRTPPATTGNGAGPEAAPVARDGPALGYALARLVPPDALAFISVADVPRFVRRASKTGLACALRDERMAPFVQAVLDGLPPEVAAMRSAATALARGLGPVLRGEAGGALLGVSEGEGGMALEGILLADVSGRSAEARRFVATTLFMRFAAGSIRTEKMGAVDAIVCRLGDETVAWCETAGMLAVASSKRALAAVLERLPGPDGAPPGIDSLPTFRRGMERASLDEAHDYRAFVDVDALFKGLPGGLLGKSVDELRSEYGISGLRAASLVGRLGTSVREALYLDAGDADAARGGIFWALGGPEVRLEAALRMPPATLFAAFGSIDGPEIARALADPRLRRAAPRSLVYLLGILSGAASRRILEGVRGEAAIAAWNDGHVGWFPRFGAIGRVRDRAVTEVALGSAWTSIAARLKGRFLTQGGRGVSDPSREVSIGFVDRPELFVSLLGSPAYGLDGRTLVVSTAATAVKRLVEEGSGLASTEGFRALLTQLPPERSALVFANIPGLVERGLEPHGPALLEMLLPGSSERLDREKLPPGEAAARHLAPAGASSARVGNGVRVDAVTPTGLVGALVVAEALARSPAPATPAPAAEGH